MWEVSVSVPVSAGEERRLGLEVAKGSPENERIGLSASGRLSAGVSGL